MSINEPIAYFEKRKAVYPRKVDGFFRRTKWAVMAVTLAIYWVTPWIRWNRGPYAPDQAVLVDLAHRRFYMFGIEIWPHEFYYVAGLLIMAGIGLFLVTSAVGRAWCGYACPQTVWTDLFQHVERAIDGDRNAQIRLARAPWSPAKIARRLAKWGVWLLIAFCTGGAWIFYFADAPSLHQAFWSGHAAPIAYGTVAFLTATTFVLGGFMREQVCIYMCPWPRIQTAMLDEKSLIVTYKDWRGEPRGSVKRAAASGAKTGDCIDCDQCVAVCPTGIDIRQGPQIGCITCALCIDACDRVMTQIGRPRGLIDYATEESCVRERAGGAPVSAIRSLLQPRTILYFGLWTTIGLAMLFAVGVRTRLDISAIQDRNPISVRLSDGAVRNSFTLKLRNMEARPRTVTVALDGIPAARMWDEDMTRASAARTLRLTIPADQVLKRRVFVVAPGGGAGREPFQFTVQALDAARAHDSEAASFERGVQ